MLLNKLYYYFSKSLANFHKSLSFGIKCLFGNLFPYIKTDSADWLFNNGLYNVVTLIIFSFSIY